MITMGCCGRRPLDSIGKVDFMEENSKSSVTLIDLVKLFRKKFKLLVVIGLVAAIIGGACGILLGAINTTYVAQIEIGVTPASGSKKLLYLLRSGHFAEQMLLEENGLPAKDECNAEDYEAALEALKKLDEIRTQRIEKRKEVSRYYISDIEHRYKELSDEYSNTLSILKMYKEAQTDALVSPTHEAMIAVYEEKLTEAEQAKNDYYDQYYAPAIDQRLKLGIELELLTDQLEDQKEETDLAVEKVMAAWRKDETVAKRVAALMKCVTYEQLILEEDTGKETENAEQVTGYIVIKIAIPASEIPSTYASKEEYVQEIQDCFETRLTDCVRNFLEEDLSVYEAECDVITPAVQFKKTPDVGIMSALKYAILFAAVAVVLAYGIFALQLVIKEEEKNASKAGQNEDTSAPQAPKK